jgi:protein-S-isoprenylcysteine O-methyltransferase Ste14
MARCRLSGGIERVDCKLPCYHPTMSELNNKALSGLLWLFAVMATIIFVFAGTLQYWQAWLYLTVFVTSSLAMTFYLMKNDPRLLERRSKGGPMAEGTTTQKIIMAFASAGFVALLIVPALDYRFGWSTMSASISLLGDVLFVLSYLAIMRVFKENTFAASTIAVEAGQQVISTGPYAHVRHPMYAAGFLLLASSPLSLGSWWGLIVFIPLLPVLIWRLLDEEEFLKNNLVGYVDYCDRVKSRLIPSVW